jgi:hypothetical protein
MFLDGVIGRRGIRNTASSLWPCQKHSLNVYQNSRRQQLKTTRKAGGCIANGVLSVFRPLSSA